MAIGMLARRTLPVSVPWVASSTFPTENYSEFDYKKQPAANP
jgi:hypothetical protein